MCARFCLTGYVKDENGCDTCKCVDPCQVTVTVTESVTLRPYWETEGASVNSKTVSGVERQIGTKNLTQLHGIIVDLARLYLGC